MSINTVTISGNIVRDAGLAAAGSGNPVMNLSVAVNERTKNQQTQQWEDRANYIDCVMFGGRAAKLAPYMTKGTKVTISGKLRQRSWQGKDGSNRSKIEVLIDEIEFMSSKGKQAQQAPAQAEPQVMGYHGGHPVTAQPAPAPQQQQLPVQQAAPSYTDDVPF